MQCLATVLTVVYHDMMSLASASAFVILQFEIIKRQGDSLTLLCGTYHPLAIQVGVVTMWVAR